MRWAIMGVGGLCLLALAACDGGARSVDYPPERATSSDIGATLNTGPTAAHPGITSSGEPIGALPWEINERHQPAD